ncbi:hypothetical protein BDF22DRAFT_8459 [Syncephalis plumigaleata]|nr:hypothetical protein BDF22DRAFT_8459 [Syncephalis plumigaleata]
MVSSPIILLTSCGGVGSVLSDKLASLGAKVAAIDICTRSNDQRNVSVYQCDITDREQLKRTANLIREQLGHPTILVNNAGYVAKGSICDVPPEDVEKVLDVNILSHFWTIREFLPSMKERRHGHIVTVASAMGWTGLGGLTSYSASKGAAITLHDALQHELHVSNSGVHTTLVCPAHIDTHMFADFGLSNQFLLPVLTAKEVATSIIDALHYKRQ